MTNDPYLDPRAGGRVPPRPPQPPLGAEPYAGDAPSGYGIGGSGGSFGDPGQPGVHPNNLPPVQREDAHMVPPGNPPAPPHQPRHDPPVAVEPQRRPQPPVEPPPADADESYAIYQAEDRSIGEIASDVLGNASTLIRQEVELAKAEVKDTAARAGSGVGMLAGAAVAAMMMLFALTLALWWGLSISLGTRTDPSFGLGGLLTALIWAFVAALLGMLGKTALNKIKGIPMTQETVQKIPNAATGNEEKNR